MPRRALLPVLALQKCGADGSPVVVLPSYCDPGRMVYDGALQSVVFADDAGKTREVWGKDYRNPGNPEDTDGERAGGAVHRRSETRGWCSRSVQGHGGARGGGTGVG